MRAVLVVDEADRDPGLLGDFLRDSDATIRYIDRERMTNESVDADVVILLGSNRSAHEPHQANVVATETELIQNTLAEGIPVIGICYGAQVLTRALGGSSRRGDYAECGWTQVDSIDEELCPSGRWGQMHHDVIEPAPTSTVIGWSPAGPQAFIDDSRGARVIGWQFHPELTLNTLERWLRQRYSGSENADPTTTIAEAALHARHSTPRATELFRAAFRYLEQSSNPSPSRSGRAEFVRQPRQPPDTDAICILGYN